jgi:hypothetical protein
MTVDGPPSDRFLSFLHPNCSDGFPETQPDGKWVKPHRNAKMFSGKHRDQINNENSRITLGEFPKASSLFRRTEIAALK